MTDLMQRIAHARPTDTELDRMWPAERRAHVLDRVRHEARTKPRRTTPRRTRWLAAAGTAVAAAVAGPALLGGSPASARAQLIELSLAAAENGGPVISEGSYLHVKTESVQRNSAVFGDGSTYDTNRESWIRWDGTLWAIDTRPSAGWTEYHRFPASDPSLRDPTPEFVNTLPTDPTELRAYLDERVQGSSSHEEAIFVAVVDLLQSHFLDSSRLSAALGVLAEIEAVDTEDVVVDGRDAVEITYTEHWWGLSGTESVTVDRATAQVLGVAESDPGGTYDSTTTLIEVVDAVPADVLASYDQHSNGSRICADGQPADDDGHCDASPTE